jgi:rSAM/selenodomain-associated transferase 1
VPPQQDGAAATAKERCAIAVMAKAPRTGTVKTRLVPPLAPHEAVALNASFLRDITENIRIAAATAPIDAFIAFAPAGAEASFDGLLAAGTRLVLADGAVEMPHRVQGLGRSLCHAAVALFDRGYESVALLNSDSPTLPTAYLRRTAEALSVAGDRIVLGPAEDGGYYLLGMKALHMLLFEDISWSTGSVAAQTRDRAKALGLEVVTLPTWYDVDDRSGLLRLLDELFGAAASDCSREQGYRAPVTANYLGRLGLGGNSR